MPNAQERMEILSRLERGEITPAEAEQLLNGMELQRPAISRMDILERVERGELSADEAANRLLDSNPAASATPATAPRRSHSSERSEEYVDFAPIRSDGALSRFFFIGGMLVTIVSALWMGYTLQRSGMNLWFFCLWLPFTAGLLALVLGWAARSGEWLQMTVGSSKPGRRNFFLSLPLPMSLLKKITKNGEAWIHINRDRRDKDHQEG